MEFDASKRDESSETDMNKETLDRIARKLRDASIKHDISVDRLLCLVFENFDQAVDKAFKYP